MKKIYTVDLVDGGTIYSSGTTSETLPLVITQKINALGW